MYTTSLHPSLRQVPNLYLTPRLPSATLFTTIVIAFPEHNQNHRKRYHTLHFPHLKSSPQPSRWYPSSPNPTQPHRTCLSNPTLPPIPPSPIPLHNVPADYTQATGSQSADASAQILNNTLMGRRLLRYQALVRLGACRISLRRISGGASIMER